MSDDDKLLIAPAKPIKLDDVKRKRDDRQERKELLVNKVPETKTLVLDTAKMHVMLQPLCKSCHNEWVAIFVLEDGDKKLVCPRCKKMSSIGVRSGDPAKTRIIQ